MKTILSILACLLPFTTQWAWCAEDVEPPAPTSVTLPESREKIAALVMDILSRLREAAASQSAAEAAQISQQIEVEKIRAEQANAQAALVLVDREMAKKDSAIAAQKETIAKQNSDIAKLEEKGRRNAVFVRAVLWCVFALVFAAMWRLTAALHLSLVPPWGMVVRIALCVGAAGLAARLLFYIVTRLL